MVNSVQIHGIEWHSNWCVCGCECWCVSLCGDVMCAYLLSGCSMWCIFIVIHSCFYLILWFCLKAASFFISFFPQSMLNLDIVLEIGKASRSCCALILSIVHLILLLPVCHCFWCFIFICLASIVVVLLLLYQIIDLIS